MRTITISNVLLLTLRLSAQEITDSANVKVLPGESWWGGVVSSSG